MKKSFLYPIFAFLALFLSLDSALAQAVISRTEFLCYDKRNDAKSDIRINNDKYIALRPTLQFEGEGSVRAVYEQEIEVPASWNDYHTYLHTESVGGDYTIFINGTQITPAIDRYTPTEMYISPYLDQGKNVVAIVVVDEPYMAAIAEGMSQPERKQFDNCYIFAQRRLGIYDFNIRLVPDSLERFAELQLDVVADNAFSTVEVIEVGYDFYAPDGKLMEYSVNDLSMEGFTRDTMHFKPYIYHSNPNRWSPANPKLYDLTLYVKRSGILWEYIPLKVGFAEYGYTEDGAITAFGKPLTLKKEVYNAAADATTTEREIKALKQRGINCLTPDYPQPRWFYDICDRVGIYVIDCAAVASPSCADDRSLGGTPANAPELVDEYLRRVETMYHRAQNHVCIIAFSLGKKAGNGYNLYKAYELLKSKGDSRAIIYEDADGEWNTDL
jgi:beta-galactosidase